jgi:hypothetical protein
MNFTYKNHLQYSIDGRLFGFRNNSIEKYIVTVGQVDKKYFKKSNYLNELRRTADLVYQDYGKDFALFLSGGTDSEIVVRNFIDIGIKPTCYTIRFEGGYNESDVNESIELAKELGVDLYLIDFDVKDFLYSGEASEFGRKLQCTQITYLMVYHCIFQVGLPAIMGGEVLLKRNITDQPSTWYFCFRENEDASAMRFSQLYNIPLVNEWFSYTPELLLYYLTTPEIQNLVLNKMNYKLTSVSSKNEILRKLVPGIRSREKTHGFENLLAFNFEAYRQLTNEQILRLEPSLDGIEYNQVISMLLGEK